MALPKQSIAVRFGKLDQSSAPRSARVVPGVLTDALNVRQSKLGRYEQRNGRSKYAKTTDSGTISDGRDLGENGGSLALRTSDSAYVRDSGGTWRNKGGAVACVPSWSLVSGRYGRRPIHAVDATGKGWYFVQDRATYYYWYTVIEESTGVEVVPLTRIAATAIIGARVVVAGGKVWYFTNEGGTIYTRAFDPAAPSTIPAGVSFWTLASGLGSVTDSDFDVCLHPVGEVIVSAVTTNILAGNKDIAFAFLDTATGARKVSPGTVGYDISLSGGCSMALMRQSVDDGYIYAAWAADDGGQEQIKYTRVSSVDLSGASTVQIATGLAADVENANLCGYVTGSTRVIFHTPCALGSTATIEDALTTRYSETGGAVTSSSASWRARHVISDPFIIGTTWYVATLHDDNTDLQRAYYIQDAGTARIVSRALYGIGGDAYQRAAQTTAGSYVKNGRVTVTVSGTTAVMPVNTQITTAPVVFGAYRVAWEFGATLGQMPTVDATTTWMPGGWAQTLNAEAVLSDAVPAMYPRTLTLTGIAGTTPAATYYARAVYVFVDRRGNRYRSAPSPAATVTLAAPGGIRFVIPTLRFTNASGLDCYIETYLYTTGLPALVQETANVTTADSITFDITGAISYGENLYTEGGVLDNLTVPAHRGAFRWRSRVCLCGTEYENQAWFSKEMTDGQGVEFSSPLKVTCAGSGQIYAGGAVSDDYCALLKRDSVHIVSGAGPDDTGAGGSFQVRELIGHGGTTNTRSVVSYPGGLMYQGLDGVIYRITPGAIIEEAGAEAQDVIGSSTVTCTAHDPKARLVHFALSDGTFAVLDYGSANETAPSGYWYKDSGGWTAAAGACAIAGTLYHAESADGEVWAEVASQGFDGTTTPVLPKLTLATLQLADLGGEFRLSRVQFVGDFVAAHSCRIGVAINGGTVTNYTTAVSAAPERFEVRPSGAGRVQEVVLSVEKTGTDVGLGFKCDGFNLEVVAKTRSARLNSAQRI